MAKNFDIIGESIRRKLKHKDRGHIFVPSSSASNGSPEGSFSRSTSHVEPSLNHLVPNTIDQRRQSSPTPLVRGPAMMPQPMQAQPPPIGFVTPLSIDTYGGECAGSGYNWIHEDAQFKEKEVQQNDSYITAQKLARDIASQEVGRKKEMLKTIKRDNQMLNDYIATAFSERLTSADPKHIEQMKLKIEKLRKEIDNLRELSPRSVPPERPPRPNAAVSWPCPQCTDESPLHEYRCKGCKFPRPEIDLNEVTFCNCPECTKTCAQRMLVSVCPGDGDWLVVNRLNH